jgi:anti-sigma factor RsiW
VGMNACPSEETLYEFLDSELSSERELEILKHLSSCERCLAEVARMRREMDAIDAGFQVAERVLEDDADVKARELWVLGEMRREGVISREPFELRKVAFSGAAQVARMTQKTVGKGITAARSLSAKAAKVAPRAVRAGGAAGKTLARGIGAVLRPALTRLEVAY